MTLHDAVLFMIKLSVVMTVFSIALDARLRDAFYLLRRPGELTRSLLAMSIVMPAAAVFLASVFPLQPAVKIALVALAVSPVPPLLPKKQLKAGGGESYIIGLLTAMSLLAIIFVPVAIALIGQVFGVEARMPSSAVMRIVFTTVLLPLAAGIAVRALWPAAAPRIGPYISLLGRVLLVVGFLPILFMLWPVIQAEIGNGTFLAITAFVLIGLTAGHLLGGPDEENRTALALATATRHPGVAIAIAQLNFPEQKTATAMVLLGLIVSGIISGPYLAWRRRHGHGGGHLHHA